MYVRAASRPTDFLESWLRAIGCSRMAEQVARTMIEEAKVAKLEFLGDTQGPRYAQAIAGRRRRKKSGPYER